MQKLLGQIRVYWPEIITSSFKSWSLVATYGLKSIRYILRCHNFDNISQHSQKKHNIANTYMTNLQLFQ